MPITPQQVALLSRMHLFRGLNEEKLAFAASCFEPVQVGADEYVFEQNQEPAAFFIVQSGRLKVTRYNPKIEEEDMLGFVDEGDFFGLDLFQENCPHQVSVQAVTAANLLRLEIPSARQLFETLPDLMPRFRLMISSHNTQVRTRLNWIAPEEYVYYIGQNHLIFLAAKIWAWVLLFVILAAALAVVIPIEHTAVIWITLIVLLLVDAGVVVWHLIDWSNDHYVITNKRVVFQEKVMLLYDSRQESPIDQIQSTTTETTQMGRLLNYGNAIIKSFTGTIVFHGVTQPEDIIGVIQELQKRSQSSLRQAETRQIEEILKQRIGLIPPKPAPPPKPAAPKQNSQVLRFQKFMADLFHLRYEMGDTIQYRTHWWILVKAVFLQTLILLGISGLQIWMLVRTVMGQMGDFPVLAVFMGLCLLWLVVGLWLLYEYVDWHNDVYLVTGDQIFDINRKPLGNEQKKVAQIKNILSIEYKRMGLIGLVLNYGTVYIRVGEAVFTFDDVFNPSDVQRELFHRLAARNLKERQAQGEAERQRMAEWISAYHRITHSK